MPTFDRPFRVNFARAAGTRHAQVSHAKLNEAVRLAYAEFAREFGRMPWQELVTVEVTGSSTGYTATLFEEPE